MRLSVLKKICITLFFLFALNLNSFTIANAQETDTAEEKPKWFNSLGDAITNLSPIIGLATVLTDFDLGKLMENTAETTINTWNTSINKYVLKVDPFFENEVLQNKKFILVPLGLYTSLGTLMLALVTGVYHNSTENNELKVSINKYITYFLSVPLFVLFVMGATKTTDFFTLAMVESVAGPNYNYIYSKNNSGKVTLDAKTLLTTYAAQPEGKEDNSLVRFLFVVVYFIGTLLLIIYGVFRRFLLTALVISAPITLAFPIFPPLRTIDPVAITTKLCLQHIGLMFGMLLVFIYSQNTSNKQIIGTVMPLLAFGAIAVTTNFAGNIVKNGQLPFNLKNGTTLISQGVSRISTTPKQTAYASLNQKILDTSKKALRHTASRQILQTKKVNNVRNNIILGQAAYIASTDRNIKKEVGNKANEVKDEINNTKKEINRRLDEK